MTDQYAEEKRWVFSFDLKKVKMNARQRERKSVPDHWFLASMQRNISNSEHYRHSPISRYLWFWGVIVLISCLSPRVASAFVASL